MKYRIASSPSKPTASMQQYQKLGLDPMQAYTAVHFRLGGSVGEAELWPLTNALTSLLRSIKCARQLGQKHNLTGDQAAHKLLLLTDHARLRTFLAEGFFTDVGCQDTRRTLAADPMVAPGTWSSRQTGPAHGMPLAVGLRKIHAWLHDSEPHGESTSTHNLTVVEREAVSSYIRDVLAQ
ncbi:hypothetical protein HaLaN_21014, partial [Haematococcus lacustris]